MRVAPASSTLSSNLRLVPCLVLGIDVSGGIRIGLTYVVGLVATFFWCPCFGQLFLSDGSRRDPQVRTVFPFAQSMQHCVSAMWFRRFTGGDKETVSICHHFPTISISASLKKSWLLWGKIVLCPVFFLGVCAMTAEEASRFQRCNPCFIARCFVRVIRIWSIWEDKWDLTCSSHESESN